MAGVALAAAFAMFGRLIVLSIQQADCFGNGNLSKANRTGTVNISKY
jgi:hypothetical protein